MTRHRHHDRALWRSRRGMLELDILLVGFARARYPHLSRAEQDAYHELLGCDDWRIWDWLQGEEPPPELATIVGLVASHAGREAPPHRGP